MKDDASRQKEAEFSHWRLTNDGVVTGWGNSLPAGESDPDREHQTKNKGHNLSPTSFTMERR
jgi:hypothetical protein